MSVQISDLRRPPTRSLAWLRRHPVVIDIAVVVIACAPHGAALIFRAYETGWWAYPLLALTAIALLFRRRWPLTVLTVVALACAFSPLARPGAGFPMIPFAFALASVASRQATGRAVLGYGIGVAATALATIPYSLSGVHPPLVAVFDPFALVALVIGVIAKSRRDQEQRLVEAVNARIEHAAVTERSRIAAEMHDVVAHALTVILSLANGASTIRARQPAKADAAVEQIATVSRAALAAMHRTLHLLRTTDADLDENLHHSGDNLPTLDELAEQCRHAGLPVAITRHGDAVPDDVALRQAIFRIVQEALTNSLRHADAPSLATVTITYRDHRVEILVEDDGLPTADAYIPGQGLTGIKQRARAFDGAAETGPRAGGGWRTLVTLYPREGWAADD